MSDDETVAQFNVNAHLFSLHLQIVTIPVPPHFLLP